jgi:hypothetical protein
MLQTVTPYHYRSTRGGVESSAEAGETEGRLRICAHETDSRTGNGKSKNNGKDEMQGSFAPLRMTTFIPMRESLLKQAAARAKQIPVGRQTRE